MSNWGGGVFEPGSYAGYVHRQQLAEGRAAPHHASDGGTIQMVVLTVLVAAAPVGLFGLVQDHADTLQAAVDLVPTSWREVEPVPLVRLGLVLLMLVPLWLVTFSLREVRRRGARVLSGGMSMRFLRWVWITALTFVRGFLRVLALPLGVALYLLLRRPVDEPTRLGEGPLPAELGLLVAVPLILLASLVRTWYLARQLREDPSARV